MREYISTNSFNGVGAGQTATLDLPVGDLVFHGIDVVYTTATAGGANQVNMEAELTAARLKVNGKVQRRFTAEELFDINGFNGIAFATGAFPIFLSEPWRRAPQGEDALGWGTQDVDTMQLEIDIAAGATAPTLEARLEVERVRRPMGPIVKWRRFNVPVSAVGLVNVTSLPKEDAYYRLHAHSAVIDDVEVNVDQVEKFKATAARNTNLLTRYGLSPVAGWFHIAFDRTQRVADALSMRKGDPPRRIDDFRVDFNMSAATGFDLITEVLGPRD